VGIWPLLGMSGSAQAHAFGARYDLPLPLWLYLGAAGAAVTASFVFIAWLPGASTDSPTDQKCESHVAGRPRLVTWLACSASVALLLVVVISAFLGADSATGNFATVFVWIVWWVGLVFFQALVVDLWSVINPWRCITRTIRSIPGRIRGTAPENVTFNYPRGLSYWPALVFFFAFVWLELVSDMGEQPRTLGALIVIYTLATVSGACVFGPDRWFERADPFTVVFSVFGRFAPIGLYGSARLRAPGQGLLVSEPVPVSLLILVMMLLATVSFDGFVETPPWSALLDWLTVSEALRGALLTLQGAGVDLLKLTKTVGLLLAIALFIAVYLCVVWLVDRSSGDPQGLRASAGSFVLSMVPIAIGYHLAHYLSYLLIAGQLIIPLASDPFHLGWDLFGTRDYAVDIAIVDARFVWYTAVATIISGHVVAVCLAHTMALRLYKKRSRAIRSQIPMLLLMVGYTMSSLWILSQPIVTP
jgi:hypothetical protein